MAESALGAGVELATYKVMAYVVMAYIVMAYIVMACIVMAYMVMAYMVMAYIAVANDGQSCPRSSSADTSSVPPRCAMTSDWRCLPA